MEFSYKEYLDSANGGDRIAIWPIFLYLALFLLPIEGALGQLNSDCVVSVLNRTVQVKADGTWVLPNIPANFGPVRARATCVENGVTRSGQSALFTIPANGSVDVPKIVLGEVTPIPSRLLIAASQPKLTQVDQTIQLGVTGIYADGSSLNLTSGSAGTQYLSSNAALASVSNDGLVTARQSGTVFVQAIHEGAQAIIEINVVLARDSDGDGIPDDVELRLGLDPNNPADGLDDPDRDGLTNKDEVAYGTDIRVADTDGDGILDGEEVRPGVDGVITNPLLRDTDGDGVPDNVEIASGSNPNDAASTNLGQALRRITVAPATFVINIDSISGIAYQQLSVTGEFKLGGTIDLTASARGTNYGSSDLQVCNFGVESGRVFGGSDGACTITVSNNGFSASASGTVKNFTPVPLSFVAIPGFANNVDVDGDYAFVAAGSTGLQVVDVFNRANPRVVAALDTPGNANDVVIAGDFAYVADGAAGLQIISVADPLRPVLVGSLNVGGDASDVVVYDNIAYLAAQQAGLKLVDITVPNQPRLVGSLAFAAPVQGVDVNPQSKIAVLAARASGLYVVDLSNRAQPLLRGTLQGGDVSDVVVRGSFAYLADYSRSFSTVDLSNPANPILRASTPRAVGGLLMDVAVAGANAVGADVLFVNGVPLIDVSNPAAPSPRAIIDFRAYRDDNGTGIALDGNYVYLTAERGLGTDNGVNGDTRLYIGQYASLQDNGGIPPQVTLTSPPNHSSVIRGAQLSLRANASDDVAVSVVTFSVDGMDVGTDSVEPYQAQYRVPPNATTLEVGARAVDPAGNVGVANPVKVTAVDDPLTTATGLVVDASTAVVAGAAVDCLGLTGASMSDGSFSVVGIPTVLGSIFCSATATNGDIRLIGASARYPAVLAGVTDVGTIILGAQKLQSRISGGYDHTCALTSAGWLKCWGDGRDGQLGDGSLNSSATPRDVAGLTSGVLAVAAGWHHSCALTSAGGLKCWGDGHDGQLGDGNVNGSATPRDVAGLTSGVLAVTAGTYHNCALTSAGGLKCWGFGENGQLGGGSLNSSVMPRDVAGFSSGVVAVAAGTYHSCALTSAGGLKCWGDSINGQVGDGSFNISATPTEVAGLSSGVVAVAAGYSHTCALTSAGGLKCWGYNAYGQLGDGSFNGSATPRDVTGLSSGVVAIAAGGNHSCALTSAGGLKCWGYNFFGQLGDGSFNRSATPRDVAGLSSGLVAVAAGGNHTCALTSAGGVKCWGFGESGQLGDGSFNSSAMPKDVIGF